MLKNYFKTALAHIWKKKTYSGLNIFGLAIGIACAGLIFLWVEDELHYDSFNIKKDRIYAVRVNEQYKTSVLTHWSVPGILGPALQQSIPGIAAVCRQSEGLQNMLFTIGDKRLYAGGVYTEPSLFGMFTFTFLEGNAQNPFPQLYSIVLTETSAKKFFGQSQGVVGKSIIADNRHEYIVSGVIKDFPRNSSINFQWAAPWQIYFQQSDWLHKWENNSTTTYVELKPGANLASVNGQLANFIQQHIPNSISHLFLFPLKDWRLHDEFEGGKQTGGGRITFVRLFGLIAWIILLIACINFMNLATARSEKRAREVGVRKVMGARRGGLIVQFLGEALFMALLAAIAAGFVISLTLPAFNGLVQKDLSLDMNDPAHVLALLGVTLICGLVAGSYPALYLSSFNPITVLKGLKIKAGSVDLIRKGLVIFQFAVSIILIVCTIVIYQQIQHVKNRQLGFKKDNLVELPIHGDMKRDFALIKHDLLNTGLVDNAAISDHETIYGGNNTDNVNWDGKTPGEKVLISYRSISPEFIQTSGLELLDGRDFLESDSVPFHNQINVVITQSLAKLMGRGSPIGKRLTFDGDTTNGAIIKGVVKDYIYGNMYGTPDPVIFIPMQPSYSASVLYVRLKDKDHDATAKGLAAIEAVLKRDNPQYPFEYKFVDTQFNDLFQSEILISKLSRIFAILAILISCLGLFGLAAYTAERRTKEIGIRKVLGASVGGITGLLSKDFIKLVVISALFAFPISWWTMNTWLQNFTYRIAISWWIFAIAGILSLVIALLTISIQSIRAATANPVKSLGAHE